MKAFNHGASVSVLSFFLLFTTILTGCKNNATGNDDEHEHLPAGVVLRMNGNEIARYEHSVVSGSIEVAGGKETALISVWFLDEDGEEFRPDEPGHSLGWEVADEAIAEAEQHSEDGKWNFHVHGKSSGETTLTVKLLHGDGGHSDLETAGIPVHVH